MDFFSIFRIMGYNSEYLFLTGMDMYGFLWTPYSRYLYFNIAQNSQNSKFNKYGHLVYHLLFEAD